MLWSVSVCDIIYKLQYLVDLYADSAAKEILAIFSNENSFNLNNPYNNLQLTPKITSDKQSDKGATLFTLQ
jgi:hypothetical protein